METKRKNEKKNTMSKIIKTKPREINKYRIKKNCISALGHRSVEIHYLILNQ